MIQKVGNHVAASLCRKSLRSGKRMSDVPAVRRRVRMQKSLGIKPESGFLSSEKTRRVGGPDAGSPGKPEKRKDRLFGRIREKVGDGSQRTGQHGAFFLHIKAIEHLDIGVLRERTLALPEGLPDATQDAEHGRVALTGGFAGEGRCRTGIEPDNCS